MKSFKEYEKSMTQAFILVNCDKDKKEMVKANFKEIKGVLDLCVTEGLYDLILKAEAEDEDKLKEDVIKKVRATDGIKSTTTLIGV